MISEGTRLMPDAIHLVLAPGLMLLAAVVSANVLAEGARDALDPRSRALKVRPTAGGLDRGALEGALSPAAAPIEGEPA